MKYKLLKDLPTFKAGEIFEIDDSGHLCQAKKDGVIAYSATTLEKFPNILTDWFEEVEEVPKRWRADVDCIYFSICEDGGILARTEENEVSDGRRFAIGNYFQTKEEAEKFRDWIKAYRTLLDDTRAYEWGKRKNAAP